MQQVLCLGLLVVAGLSVARAFTSSLAGTGRHLSEGELATDILSALSTFTHHPPSFKIEDRFTANVSLVGPGKQMPPGFEAMNGTFVYDAVSRVSVQIADVILVPFGNISRHQKRINTNSTVVMTWEEACATLPQPGSFMSVFEIFALIGNYTGKSTVHGRHCDMYNISGPPPLTSNMSLCVADGRWPLQLSNSFEDLVFYNFNTTVDPADITIPEVCSHTPASCGDGAAVSQTIYVSHPKDRYNISSQNVADAKGDAVFLCFDSHMATAGDYELLSAFDLTIIRNFTQYANYPPPGGKGFGGDLFHVGRETSLGIGKHWGQCADDAAWREQFGSWLSLPRAGQCVDGSQTLGKDCMWRIERRSATIELSCLAKDKGLQQQCSHAMTPFTEITETLLKAMWAEDAAHGACPRVVDAECTVHPQCAHLKGDCCPHEDGTMFECCNRTTKQPSLAISV